MKIKPVAKAAPSPIPTAAEAAADPSLLAPAVRRGPRGAGALLGAGLLGGLFAPAAVGADEAVPPPEVPMLDAEHAADAEAAARAEEAREAVATVVAPILQKALDEEGRGGFGCISIDPPVMLSEADALDLIEQEFAKAGVKLRRDCEISGFTRTVPDTGGQDRENETWLHPAMKGQGNWVFDLATEDGSLALEFLSREDAYQESFLKDRERCFDEYIDFIELAQRLGGDFSTRTNGKPVAIGIFFDPLVHATVWDKEKRKSVPRPGSSFVSFSDAEIESLLYTDWGKRIALLNHDARELLREQVRFFLDWARKEGKLPVSGQQPSADESPMEPREQP